MAAASHSDSAVASHAVTRGGAYACFRERKQGLIAPGYIADFAVFDRDLFTTDPETIDQAKVLQTVVGGVRRFG